MTLSEVFIRRPVLSVVVSLLILLMGLQSALSLAVRQYPKVEDTVITVTTAYPGAASELIQGFITTPIAQAVSSTENVDYVTSSSQQGKSSVLVHMRLGADPDKALTEVLAKVQTVRGILPQDAEDPIVIKGTGFNLPLMFVGFWSKAMTPQQISEYLTRVVSPRLATVPGVAETRTLGAPNFAMRIWLDPIQLASHNVTAAEVSAAIRNANFLAAPGKVQSEVYAYAVQTDTTLRTPEAFGMLPLRGSGEQVVRLRDVARVELGAQNYDERVILKDGEGVFIAIFTTPGANPLEVAKAIRVLFPSIEANMPPGLKMQINYDSSVPIQASIHEVFKTMAEAVLIVILVIFLFLGSLRTVLIPTVTIPLSLVGVCFVLLALGYSINLMTLLAMVLAIGLVVDDAIVVVENVHRHLDMGQKPIDAAISAMKEIFGPIIAMTITLAAVYAPIGFVQGLTGTLFREFAYALAGAVIISGVIAVTLSPMMSSRILKHETDEGEEGSRRAAEGAERFFVRLAGAHAARLGWLRRLISNTAVFFEHFPQHIDRVFARLSARYQSLLRAALAQRIWIAGLVVVVLGTTFVLFKSTPGELAPKEDEGFVMAFVTGPRYATADYTAEVLKRFGTAVGELPEEQTDFGMIGLFGGVNSGFRGFVLKPWSERGKSAMVLEKELQKKASTVSGAGLAVIVPSTLPGTGDGLPVQYVLRTVGDPDQVYAVAEKVVQRAMQSGRFIIVQNSMSYDLPQVKIEIDRERAAALGVPVSDIGATLSTLMSEAWVSRFDQGNRSYQVIPQVNPADRFDPEKMGQFYVRGQSGSMVPLSALVTIKTDAGPQAIEQFNQLNSATLSAIPMPGTTLNDAIQVLRDIAKEVMPDGFFEEYAGQARIAAQEGNSLAMAFIFAVLVIYLVLAAQFESFRDPLIIMTAVPLSIFGALVPLNLGAVLQVNGASVNIYSQLGLITLVGLIAKHGILLVQFANDRRAAGVSREEAIIEAAHVRLRPILMTTAAMVMGVMPLLIASGAGASARFSIGLVIASGMAVGTVFTLFVVPVFYTYISKREVAVKTSAQALAYEDEFAERRRRAH